MSVRTAPGTALGSVTAVPLPLAGVLALALGGMLLAALTGESDRLTLPILSVLGTRCINGDLAFAFALLEEAFALASGLSRLRCANLRAAALRGLSSVLALPALLPLPAPLLLVPD